MKKATHIKAHMAPGPDSSAAVLARAVGMAAETLPAGEFCYLPAGEHQIEARVDGKPGLATVLVTAAAATALQADLARRLASGPAPHLDYNHENAAASGHPQEFKWVEGIGVVCRVQWTPGAVQAIRSGEWRYFSPEFRWDRKTKAVLGLNRVGPLGGLVNDPAFRAMPAIAARHAAHNNNLPDDDRPELPQPKPQANMNEKAIVAALSAAGILSPTEAAADNAPALVQARIAALRDGESVKAAHTAAITAKDDRIKALEDEIAKVKEEKATACVDAAVKAGRIAPKDTATQDFWKGAIVRDGEASIKALNAVPVQAALKPTHSGTTEEQPDATKAADDAEAAAISARAVAIASERKMPFQSAWPIAEAEVKAQRVG